MLTVHVRVNDASTGKPTPVRMRLVDGNGVYHAPLGRMSSPPSGALTEGNLLLNGSAYSHIDGSCEVRLPVGPITVDLSKGPEYVPIRTTVTLKPGQLALRFALERWVDLRAERWYSGDARAHALSPHAAALEGAAEGLAVVNLLARERPEGIENIVAFSGTQPALPNGECLVAVNTLNTHPILGSVGLLDSHRPVYPLSFGGPLGSDDWSVADWCDQCHRKRGLVTWPDLPRLHQEVPQGEALAAMILGKVDAFEFISGGLTMWDSLLNCGIRSALVGASGKESNAIPLGRLRTYAKIDHDTPFSLSAWFDSVRAGRTFITNGPLLSLEVAGQGPGGTVTAEVGQRVKVSVRVRSARPVDCVLLMVGGKAAASGSDIVEDELVVSESTWIAARCWGKEGAVAHTSAVMVRVASAPPRATASDEIVSALDATEAWVSKQARCEARHREHLLGVLRTAREELARRASEG
jgi:hypothetical protein